jgi:4-carboxymuconolactone decarboxylase
VITYLAFYVGWPNAFSALPATKEVFEKRPNQHVDRVDEM